MIESWSPTTSVIIWNPYIPNLQIRVDGLIDTGSDVTAITPQVIHKLGLTDQRRINVTGIDGLTVSQKRYVVDFEIAGIHLERRGVIEWRGDFVIIGIDLLSEFTFTYDGKNREFEIKDP